ncbi:MAG: NAD-dependent epimerase/dehydratase family protein [Promethearchaeia archaeon]
MTSELKERKILITGATGFIGKWLTLYLYNKGFQLIAHGSSEESIRRLKTFLREQNIDENNLEYWQENFLKDDWKFPNFSDIDAVIHCAAITKVREGTLENYDKYFQLNVVATKIIAKKALEEKIKHFIHLSTGQVFGKVDKFPITEQTPKNPINLYGITKLMGEQVIASLGMMGLNYTIIRPFSVYGKMHQNIIAIITNKIKNNEELTIYGDGNQKRAFLHVDDICNAIFLILFNEKCFEKDYNLSGEKEYSVNDLVNLLSKKFEKEPKIVYKKAPVNELNRNIADLTKIKLLGFRPQKTLEDFIFNEL